MQHKESAHYTKFFKLLIGKFCWGWWGSSFLHYN